MCVRYFLGNGNKYGAKIDKKVNIKQVIFYFSCIILVFE